jgi:hypothetical protein
MTTTKNRGPFLVYSVYQCCGAGSGGSIFKLPPGSEAVFRNYGSGSRFSSGSISGSSLFYERLEKILLRKSNCYYFNPKMCINPRNKVLRS